MATTSPPGLRSCLSPRGCCSRRCQRTGCRGKTQNSLRQLRSRVRFQRSVVVGVQCGMSTLAFVLHNARLTVQALLKATSCNLSQAGYRTRIAPSPIKSPGHLPLMLCAVIHHLRLIQLEQDGETCKVQGEPIRAPRSWWQAFISPSAFVQKPCSKII